MASTVVDTGLMDDAVDEELLVGGHDSGPVIRIGHTVRRTVRPWTSSVHTFLRHFESEGFHGAPRPLGIDEHGREILTFIPGADGRAARCYDDPALVQVAQMIRSLHHTSASFTSPRDSRWRPDHRAPPGSLICHNDLSPANTIYRDGRPQAFIDWDFTTPTTVLWDLSYAVRTFVPLYSSEDCVKMGYRPKRREHRLGLFCDAYGMDAPTRSALLPMVQTRLEGETSAFAQRCLQTLHTHWNDWSRTTAR